MVAVSRVGVEEQLYDYAKRLARYRSGRRAVWVRLSRLTKPYRQPSYQRAAREPFARLLRRYDGQLFTLPNQDFLCVLKGASASELERAVLAVEALVRDDPNLRAAEADGRDLPFLARFYDIAREYDSFFALAEAVAQGRDLAEIADEAAPSPEADRPSAPPAPSSPAEKAEAAETTETTHAVRTDVLAGVLRHLGRADVRPFLKREDVRLLGATGRRAVVMDRLGFDMKAVQEKLAPSEPLPPTALATHAIRRALAERLLDHDPQDLLPGGGRPVLLDFSLELLAERQGHHWLENLVQAAGETPLLLVLPVGEVLGDTRRLHDGAAAARRTGLKLAAGGLPCATAPLFRDQEQWPVAMLLFSAAATGSLSPAAAARLLEGLAPERMIWCADDGGRLNAPRAIRLTAPW